MSEAWPTPESEMTEVIHLSARCQLLVICYRNHGNTSLGFHWETKKKKKHLRITVQIVNIETQTNMGDVFLCL